MKVLIKIQETSKRNHQFDNWRINWNEDSYTSEGIYLEDNPLESPPIEIVQKGRNAVQAYFKSLEGEKQALNEVKVLLVGDGGAGKTSLVKQLLGEKFNRERIPNTWYQYKTLENQSE